MFYVAILRDIFGNDLTIIKNPILGSIVECHARGILSYHYAIEYHDIYDNEIDYVNTHKKLAIEFKATNKSASIKQFRRLPENYKFVALTADISETRNSVEYVSYPEFLSKYLGYHVN